MEATIKFIDNPKEFYLPGEKFKAEVTIKVPNKERVSRKFCYCKSFAIFVNTFSLRITEVNCEILGYANCKWYEDRGNGHSDQIWGKEKYIKEKFSLFDASTEDELTPGLHKYNISYALASSLPTSFKCKNGSIKYKVRINVIKSWKDLKFDFPFTIIRPLNLNSESPALRNPMKEELSKTFKFDFTPEPLHMSAKIPFTGYVPGQTINVQIQVNNQSKTHVKEVKVSLKQIVALCSYKPKKRVKELVLSQDRVSTDSVPGSTTQIFNETLVVPSLPPNILNCDVIQVNYELRVKAKTSGLSRSPKLKLPIMIGTVPLENRGDSIPSPRSCSNLRKLSQTFQGLMFFYFYFEILYSAVPPSYEQALRDAAADDESSEGDNNFCPSYPVFDFEEGENSNNATNN